MKGDFWQVTYRTPTGLATEKVQATRDGSFVDATFPGRNEHWLMIEELNKAGAAIRTARFAQSEVIAVVQGHEKLARPRKK